ncbi:uncharacterized protein PITG_01494 [Phytophthora infestans T30-4]|uniref:Uncharacterized protein n=1 Tax=Phytophthora infestans (strain T30-4) TaxID=403677 RepID=D0MTE1_PHYIT|nr:uncharacterized protein PITG_01494 [Phytophthora infestans T30-4]EEY61238.1 conserved hypothetical protein [Phytophthora infestans T30-4]|eukprot:XP_002908155.1 conserved hypothetical protein [Phytophthora infestans T30-4]
MLPPLPPVAAPVDKRADPLEDNQDSPLARDRDPLVPDEALHKDTSPLVLLVLVVPDAAPLPTLIDPPVSAPWPPTSSIKPPVDPAVVEELSPAVIDTWPPLPAEPSPTFTNTEPPLPPSRYHY